MNKLKCKDKNYAINYCFVLLLELAIVLSIFSNNLQSNIFIVLISSIFNYIFFWKLFGKDNIGYSFFVLSFIVFHFGLLFLYTLNNDTNYFYLLKFDESILNKVVQFQFLCVLSLFFIGGLSPFIAPLKYNYCRRFKYETIYKFGLYGFYICTLVECILLLLKIRVFLSGGYEGVRNFEGTIPTPIYLMEYFFMPFALLVFVFQRRHSTTIKTICIIWCLITAMMGDRTVGIAGLVVLMILDVYKGKKMSLHSYAKLIIGFLILTILISFISLFRVGNSTSDLGNPIVESLAELGFNFVPVAYTIKYFINTGAFEYGKTFIFSTIAAFIPSSIDITGISALSLHAAMYPADLIQDYSGFDFGIGYSLCAEAYANFGIYGFIVIAIEAFLIVKLLKFEPNNKFSIYASLVLLYEYFTVPRRNFYYILNHFFWCVVFLAGVISILVFVTRLNNERANN